MATEQGRIKAERKAERLTEELVRIESRLRAISCMADDLGDVYAAGGLDAVADALHAINVQYEAKRVAP